MARGIGCGEVRRKRKRARVVKRVVKIGPGSITLTGFYTEKVNGRNRIYAHLDLNIPTNRQSDLGDREETFETVSITRPITREVYRRLNGRYKDAKEQGMELTIADVGFEADFSGLR